MDPWIPLMVIAVTTLSNGQNYDQAQNPGYEPKLVCYYSNWAVYRPGLAKFTPENINPYLCTHIIYAFASLSEDFKLQPFDPYNDVEQGNYRSFVNLKSYNPTLKTLIAVGGWNEGSRRFSKLVESEENRKTFVISAIDFLREHGFDGLDLDWEYPAFRDGGNQTTDKLGYSLLIKELRHAIEMEQISLSADKLLLSVAVPATKEYIDGGFDVPEITKHSDFINLLTYDYHSAYESEAQHHAALYPAKGLQPQDEENFLNVDWTVNYYLSLGATREKLIVGIPLYGRSFTLAVPQLDHGYGAPAESPGDEGSATREKGYLAYYEICQKVKDDSWEVEAPLPELMGPFAHKANQWVGFDDEEMLVNKARYILDNHLGGAMVWTLDNDDFRGLCTGEPSPLVGTVRDVLLGSNLIVGSSSRRSVARSAEGPQDRSVFRFDDEAQASEPPRRRNTLRRLVQNRQAARNRQAAGRHVNTGADKDNTLDNLPVVSTPAPPPTPDPGVGTAFECEDEGFFNNPRDCRKYFWCLDSGPANLGVVAHAFTCPSGLHFNSVSESCDYPENVVCPVGSTGASPLKPHHRPRARTTTTSSTTTTTTTIATEPPTTTTEEPEISEKDAISTGGGNVAELLRLLQSIGGVERLQSLLGAQQNQASRSSVETTRTLPQYVTPHRTLPEAVADPITSPEPKLIRRRPQHDPYEYEEEEDDDEEDIGDFNFRYKEPSRTAGVKPQVTYVTDIKSKVQSSNSTPYEAPLRPVVVISTTPSTQQTSSKAPYRTPIRVQVGRVVRVQNGTLGSGEPVHGGRRRMLVRVRPGGNRVVVEGSLPLPTAEGSPQVTGRSISSDEKRLSGSTLLATRANPIGAAAGSGGEARIAVRKRPAHSEGLAHEDRGRGVRLVARRPKERTRDRGNYVTVRRRPTTSEVTTPATTTTSTTTTTTPESEYYQPHSNSSDYEYYDEYYDEYEDDTTTSSTTTTTTTRKPTVRLPQSSNRRRPNAEIPKAVSPHRATSPPRSSSRRASSNPLPSTTPRPVPKMSEDGEGPPVEVLSDNQTICHRRGVFIHPSDCSKFVVCAPISRTESALKGRVLNCPANQIYLVDIGRCMKGNRSQCQKL